MPLYGQRSKCTYLRLSKYKDMGSIEKGMVSALLPVCILAFRLKICLSLKIIINEMSTKSYCTTEGVSSF